MNPDKVSITWDWVSCSDMVDNTQPAKLAVKEGSSAYWFAFQISNTLYPISDMTISNIDIQRQSYGFFQGTSSSGLTMPSQLVATDIGGGVYSETFSSIPSSGVFNITTNVTASSNSSNNGSNNTSNTSTNNSSGTIEISTNTTANSTSKKNNLGRLPFYIFSCCASILLIIMLN